MDRDRARALLDAVAAGTLPAAEALDALAVAPYEQVADAFVDTHRALRTGDPEVVYGAGKTTAQVLDVVARLAGERAVLVTRATPEAVDALRSSYDEVLRFQPE